MVTFGSSPVRCAAALLVAALVFGCEPKVVGYQLKVVTESCEGTSPLDGVTHFRFQVTGAGISKPIEKVAPVGVGSQEMPEIPSGLARVIEVRGYQGPPPGGRVVSVGRTVPFDVPDEVPLPVKDIELAVFLRRVNAFQRTALSVSPGTCSTMLNARAGHTASLMPDGRVMLAGGVQTSSGGAKTLASRTEYFNPATGGFEEGPLFQSVDVDGTPTPMARAFHSASTLPNGKVLFAGGETYEAGTATALRSGAIFDPVTRQFGTVTLDTARTRHSAAVDVAARVLLIGGEATGGGAVATAEWYDPSTATFAPLGVQVPRVGARALPLQGGKRIAVVGGSDGAVLRREILFFEFTGSTFGSVTSAAALSESRRSPGVTLLGGDQQMVVAAGFNTPVNDEQTSAIASSEIVVSSSMQVSEGPAVTARGEMCAVTLPDGRAVTIGGRSGDFGFLNSDASAELITPSTSGPPLVLGVPNLGTSRYHHTCTVLLDGTVLVTGGTFDEGGTAETLQDAYIFTPVPPAE